MFKFPFYEYHYKLIWAGAEIEEALEVTEKYASIRIKKWDADGQSEIIYAKVNSSKYYEYEKKNLNTLMEYSLANI